MKTNRALLIAGSLLAMVLTGPLAAKELDKNMIQFTDGKSMQVSSAECDGDFLKVSILNGTLRFAKSELSPETRHRYFGDPLPASS